MSLRVAERVQGIHGEKFAAMEGDEKERMFRRMNKKNEEGGRDCRIGRRKDCMVAGRWKTNGHIRLEKGKVEEGWKKGQKMEEGLKERSKMEEGWKDRRRMKEVWKEIRWMVEGWKEGMRMAEI